MRPAARVSSSTGRVIQAAARKPNTRASTIATISHSTVLTINGVSSVRSSATGWYTQTFHATTGTVANPAARATLPSRSVYQLTPVSCPSDC